MLYTSLKKPYKLVIFRKSLLVTVNVSFAKLLMIPLKKTIIFTLLPLLPQLLFTSLQEPDFSLFIIHAVWSFRNVAAGNLAVTGFWQNTIPNQQSMGCDIFLPARMHFHTLRYVLAHM